MKKCSIQGNIEFDGFPLFFPGNKDKALLFQCESSENCELCIGISFGPIY